MRLTSGPAEARVAAAWEERTFRAMGSPARIVLGDPPAGLADWALDEVARCERSWSRFDPGSDLARLNAGSGPSVVVSPLLALAVDRALRLSVATDGRFDPTVHDALVAAGYDRPFAELDGDRPDPADPAGPAPGPAGVVADPGSGLVLRPSGVRVDLGGVGKGLAADLVADGCVSRGARAVAVELGGDVRVAGDHRWPVPVEDPLDESRTAFEVELRDAAVVTSTRRFRRWRRAGREAHHLIEPSTGRPGDTGLAAVVAVAGEAWWAEGLAKAAFLAGPRLGTGVLQGAGAGGWLVTDDGRWIDVGLCEEVRG